MSPFDQQEFEQATRAYDALPRPSLPAMPEGHRRLLVLAEFLKSEIVAAEFDMQSWVNECGSPSCAIGYATTIPEFRAAGFKLGKDGFGFEPQYRGWHAFRAVQHFFDLEAEDSWFLFSLDHYQRDPSPNFVAARIRTFVAEQSSRATSTRKAEIGG